MRYLIPIIFCLSGCVATTPTASMEMALPPGDVSFVQTAIANSLKDPDAAKFRGMEAFRLANGDHVICGEVNGKNSFGAYVGFETFFVRFDPVTYAAKKVYTGTTASIGCAQARAGTINVAEG
jgi:hypothetical protein